MSDDSAPTNENGRLTGLSRSALFEALCQNSPDAVVVVQRNGTIVFVNQRCIALLGYTSEELLGEAVEVLVPHHGRDHRQMRERFHETPRPRHMGTRPVLGARHKSGAIVPVDISLSPLPLEGFEGGPFTQAVVRDAEYHQRFDRDRVLQGVAMNAAANGIVITDTRGVIEWVNPAVTRMTGYLAEELVGQHTRILKSEVHQPAFYQDLWQTITAGETWYGEISNCRKDGTLYREEQHISPVRGEDGVITHFIAIKQDVTARKEAEEKLQETHEELTIRLREIEELHQKLREEAIRDPLTRLFNRRYLRETLAREMSRAKREEIDLAVLAIDIDHFKPLNDTMGHAAGDAVLVALAELLQSSIRESDIACRMGGDELLVVMPRMSLDMAQERAHEWRAEFIRRQQSLGNADRAPVCTLSIGVTNIRKDDPSIDALLERSDRALYQAKRQGRDRVVTQA